MLALLRRQPQAIAEESLHQDDHLTAVGGPGPGFGEGQGHMVIVAALAATNAGKLSIHGASKPFWVDRDSAINAVIDAARSRVEASCTPAVGS
ncbi:hypothetical protein PproGo58_47750 [Pseudomonas protegens]|nr:hypothetical protein PproGo58_47750 [Pseudomonas protegens]